MTPIEQLNTYLAANPTAKACVYEVLIRGAFGNGPGWGINAGAHFRLSYTVPGPLGDERRDTDALPAAMAGSDQLAITPLADVLPILMVQAQQTIDAQTATLAENEKTIQDAAAALDARAKEAVEREATIQQLTAALAVVTAERDELRNLGGIAYTSEASE